MAENITPAALAENTPLLRIRNMKTYFPVGKKGADGKPLFVKAVDDVSMDIYPGEVVGLVGESGSGKSTIAYTLMGMYQPLSGEIWYDGKKLDLRPGHRSPQLKKDIQIVFQDPGSSLNPRQTVKSILSLPLKVHGLCKTKEEIDRRVAELLEMVELPASYMYKTPGAMGGGERQMVSIARALASEPRLVLLDEPTSALDVSIQAKIINMLLRLQREKHMTYIFITHDLSLMRNISTRVAILYLGRIAEFAPTEDFFSRPEHPYTKMLLSSIPVVSLEEEAAKPARVESRGEIPSPVNIPPGCSFHQRCYAAMDQCSKEDPEMRQVGPRHIARCHLCQGQPLPADPE